MWRWEGERLELVQQIETEKESSKEALLPLENLQIDFNKLSQEITHFFLC